MIDRVRRACACGAGWVVLAAFAGCAQLPAHPDGGEALVFSRQPVPLSLARLDAPLRDLVRQDSARHDPQLARQVRALLASRLQVDARYLDRILDGADGATGYFSAGRRDYLYFSSCHPGGCEGAIDLLYDPVDHRLAGRLLERCAVRWLGGPDEGEMTLLDHLARSWRSASAVPCSLR